MRELIAMIIGPIAIFLICVVTFGLALGLGIRVLFWAAGWSW